MFRCIEENINCNSAYLYQLMDIPYMPYLVRPIEYTDIHIELKDAAEFIFMQPSLTRFTFDSRNG